MRVIRIRSAVLLLAPVVWAATDDDVDLYEALEVGEDAQEAEIKKQYRKLSIKWHPDKNPGEEARQRFNAIRDAYEILSDPKTRMLYDTGGREAIKQHEKGQIEEGEDMNIKSKVKLADLYIGSQKKVHLRRRIICRRCRSHRDPVRCKGCSRCPSTYQMVQFRQGNMIYRQRQEVPSSEDCRSETKALDLTVEKGSYAGDRVFFHHMASQMPGEIPGHVIVTLEVEEDRVFKRRGKNLMVTIEITLREALLGWTRKLRHLDGHIVHLQTEAVTKPGQVIRIAGEGMPDKEDQSQYGDLDVVVKVVFPTSFTKGERQELMGLQALERHDRLSSAGRRSEL